MNPRWRLLWLAVKLRSIDQVKVMSVQWERSQSGLPVMAH